MATPVRKVEDDPTAAHAAATLSICAPEGTYPLTIMWVTGWIWACLHGGWGAEAQAAAKAWVETITGEPEG